MSEQQTPYLEMNRIYNEKRNNESILEQQKQRKAQKLLDCEREVTEEYLAIAQPLLTTIENNSNQLLELEHRTMGSITPVADAIRDLRIHLDERFTDLDHKFDRKFNDLDRKFDRKFNDLDRKISGINLHQVQLRNFVMSRDGQAIVPVPFLDGTWPEDNGLPEINSVQDIDSLSRTECREYLAGYGVSFAENETLNLKKKLRTVIGFGLVTALTYSFGGFGS